MSTYDTQIPGAGGIAGADNLAQRAYANAMARLQQRRSQVMLRAGVHRNAGGQIEADANNELGQYQQMLRSEAGSVRGLERAQAASGWGSASGYEAQQADDLTHAQAGEQANFGTQLESDLSGLDAEEAQAAYDRDAALYQAQQTAEQQAPFDPGNYSGLDQQVDYSPPAPTPKPKAKPKPTPAQNRARLVQQRAKNRARGRRR